MQQNVQVPSLRACLQVGKELQDQDGRVQRVLRLEDDWDVQQDPEHVAWLARETVQAGRSVLIFCGTKKVMPAPEDQDKGVFWFMGLRLGV